MVKREIPNIVNDDEEHAENIDVYLFRAENALSCATCAAYKKNKVCTANRIEDVMNTISRIHRECDLDY